MNENEKPKGGTDSMVKGKLALAAELVRLDEDCLDLETAVGFMLELKLYMEQAMHLHALRKRHFLDRCRESGEEFLDRVAVKSAEHPLAFPEPAPPSCPACGGPTRRNRGKMGNFWGCTGYPECRGSLDIDAAPDLLRKFREGLK